MLGALQVVGTVDKTVVVGAEKLVLQTVASVVVEWVSLLIDGLAVAKVEKKVPASVAEKVKQLVEKSGDTMVDLVVALLVDISVGK